MTTPTTFDTSPVLRRSDERAYGNFQTMHLVLEVYDHMQRAIDDRVPYRFPVDTPPADSRVAHSDSALA